MDSVAGFLLCLFICFVSLEQTSKWYNVHLSILYFVILTPLLAILIFFTIIYFFRRDNNPIIYGRLDQMPHKFTFSFLHSIKSYYPSIWMFNKHLETAIPNYLNVSIPFKLTKEIINVTSKEDHLHDGKCALEWSPLPKYHPKNQYENNINFLNDKECKLSRIPIIIIVAGLTGDVRASYVQRVLLALYKNNWQGVIFHARGRGGLSLSTPQAYNVGYTEDLRQCIQHIKTKYPKRPIFGVGFSLGSNYLCKLVGEDKENCLLSGAVCLACIVDCTVCNYHIAKTPIYDRILTKLLHKVFGSSDVLNIFSQNKKIKTIKALSSYKLREFDHYAVAPQFGFRSSSEYYRKSSCGYYLQDIRKPLLMINSKNDVIVPWEVLQEDDFDGNPFIAAIITRYGSHGMSWLTDNNIFKGQLKSWSCNVIIEFFRAVLALELKQKTQNKLQS